jgi:probable F420-dependent oxidoreductase
VHRGGREGELAAAIGPVGVWNAGLSGAPAKQVRAAAAEIEGLGYRSAWLPEGGKDVFVNSAVVLAATGRLVVATGIANPWIRDPYAMATASRTLGDAFSGRFVLGVGISHHGQRRFGGAERYERPLTQMREYLDAMDDGAYWGPVPRKPVQRVLAALGPRMLQLAAERSRGAHTYLVPVEHTSFAREVLGPEAVLAVEQSFVLGGSRDAREIARRHVGRYLKVPNYRNNLMRLGFTKTDLRGRGSDRLLDAIVASGNPAKVAERVRDHLDAGADHVCVQPLAASNERVPLAPLRKLASALGLPAGEGFP